MLQERTGGRKDDSKLDFIYLVLLVVIIVFIRRILDFFAALPSPWNSIVQGLLFIGLIVMCYLFYAKRLCDYRYSIVYHQPAEGEENIFGEQKQYPWAEGTVLFERMVGSKGKLIEEVKPGELVALLEPGEAYIEKIGAFRLDRLATARARKCHTLIYRRKDKLYAARFTPSGEMARRIREAAAKGAPD